MIPISETDLILNPDGSVYHLNLLPCDIADIIITVGDPDRVGEVSIHFDSIELIKQKREFVTHTGYIGKKRVTVISTGIGTDNIDIVLNELDALANIDFKYRTEHLEKKSLTIIRIGTTGSLQENVPLDSLLVSAQAIGLDSLMHYYSQTLTLEEEHFKRFVEVEFSSFLNLLPYVSSADESLLKTIGGTLRQGITVTAPGFYAPQGRELRARSHIDNLVKSLQNFNYNQHKITNLEMETAGIYALSKILGHKALSVNAVVANRVTRQFSQSPQSTVNQAIKLVLENIF